MSSTSNRRHPGVNAWNSAAALKLIDSPSIKNGKTTRGFVAQAEGSLKYNNIHTLSEHQIKGKNPHKTFLDYDHSKRLPSQALELGFIQNPVTAQQHASATEANGKAPELNTTTLNSFEEKREFRPSDPFAALAQSVQSSSDLLPHLRTAANSASNDARGSKASDFRHYARHSDSSTAPSDALEIQPSAEKGSLHSPNSEASATSLASTPKASISHLTPGKVNDAEKPIYAGLKEKSAARDSAFPCSYPDCTMGFSRAKDLKRHKLAEHEWCSICDVDCEDDVALIEHRKASTLAEEGKHMACLTCGEDFKCEAGRNRHTKLAHPEVQEIRCPGCGEMFERGAGLLAHVDNNKCKDRSGVISKTFMSKGRINAALEMENLSMSSPLVFPESRHSSVCPPSDVNGGVPLPESLIDKDENGSAQNGAWGNNSVPADRSNAENLEGFASEASGDETETEVEQVQDLPYSNNLHTGQKNSNEVLMDERSITSSFPTTKVRGWEKHHSQDGPSTPDVGGWRKPKSQRTTLHSGRKLDDDAVSSNSLVSDRMGNRVRTDWDRYVFERDATGKYKCPFRRCAFTYIDEAAVKTHLISGYHEGTETRCVKCLRLFKNPAALLAHMESPSLKCNVRDSEQYGHLIYMVSGGFIDVNNDEKGTKLPDGQLRMRAPTMKELVEQQAAQEKEQRERERRLAAEW